MKFLIEGGNKFSGKIAVQGSKNSVLPILAATLLVDGKSVIHNCPRLSDVDAAIRILTDFGCAVTRENDTLTVDSTNAGNCRVSDLLSRRMRSSILFLAPAVSRFGKAQFSFPGGCEIGLRPIDLHLSSLRLLGADTDEKSGMLCCKAVNGFKGNRIHLTFPSVGATETVLLAAAVSKGTTVLTNAAREPEIVDLANFLNKAGARIIGAGENAVIIVGAPALNSIEYRVIPDRIVTATYLFCAAITGGEIEITKTKPQLLEAVFPLLEETGCAVRRNKNTVFLSAPERLRPVRTVRTMPYPGFPTDLQSPVTALLCVADGTSVVTETIFENRHKYIGELIRLGADIRTEGATAIIGGVENLHGASVRATDLRGGFALVIAALKADGKTVIDNIYHIDRGYETPERVLSSLGANIKRIT
ncbi:MAG: UDP-N-acetylglucosamine 1-carboxyvinyltransferase [Clostridiales bacterium]|nr:UDP-N-acetylglucosamine 1-carboxyvinyltransferase [Clostridiales bacterium]